MFGLIEKTVRKNLISLLIYAAISVAFVWMYVAFYPAIAKQSQDLKEAFQSFPQEFFQAFDIEIDTFISSLEGFMAGEYYSIIWPIILLILIISYASSAIAGEIEKGTIEILLSQPISRLKIFLAKYFSGLTIFTVFILLTNFSIVPFAVLHNVDFHLRSYFYVSIIGFLFAFAVFGICTLASAVSSTRGRPAAVTGGLLIIMYAINIFSAFQKSLDDLKFASFFHYYDFKSALVHNQIDWVSVVVFLGVGITASAAAAFIFIKRDIATT